MQLRNWYLWICPHFLLAHPLVYIPLNDPSIHRTPSSVMYMMGERFYSSGCHVSNSRFLYLAWRFIDPHIISSMLSATWDLVGKNMEYTGFFFCQTVPSWLRISGGNAYYFPGCNLNLLNCLQIHLFLVAQWESPRASALNTFLFHFSCPKAYLLGGCIVLIW